MLTTLALLSAISGAIAPIDARASDDADRPRVSVWTDHGDDPYPTGRSARVYVRSDRDAYVTIFRIDTDGRVRILFPRDPWEDNFVRGGREFEIQATRSGDAFDIDDYPGVGYVFAVASPDPFDYDPITSGDHWDYRIVADGRVRGDPYVALTDLAQRIVASGDSDWDYDLVPYYVERHYDYPRFLCYDCHSYASYSAWDPYAYSCVRFRIVEYDDPYYYPYRYYGGTRVVFTRPLRPEPRFIFKDRDGLSDDRFVTHARDRDRPLNDDTRRGVRGTDLGGRGSVPAPRVDPRRRVTDDEPRRVEVPRSNDRTRRPTDDRPDWRGRTPERGDDGSTAQPSQPADRGDDQGRRRSPPPATAPEHRPDQQGRSASPPKQGGDDGRRPSDVRGRQSPPPKKDNTPKPELRRRRP
jgi:hypothetical protein